MTTDVQDNRKANLRQLIERNGGPKPLAARLGYSGSSFLVQMAGPNPTRKVTEATARAIERKMDLPAGVLDAPPASASLSLANAFQTHLVTHIRNRAANPERLERYNRAIESALALEPPPPAVGESVRHYEVRLPNFARLARQWPQGMPADVCRALREALEDTLKLCREEGREIPPDRIANIVVLALADGIEHENVRPEYVRRLVETMA